MTGSHVINISDALRRELKAADQQIAGLWDMVSAAKRFYEGVNLGEDYTRRIVVYAPKARRGPLEPIPFATRMVVHFVLYPAYATIVGVHFPERGRLFGDRPPNPDECALF